MAEFDLDPARLARASEQAAALEREADEIEAIARRLRVQARTIRIRWGLEPHPEDADS